MQEFAYFCDMKKLFLPIFLALFPLFESSGQDTSSSSAGAFIDGVQNYSTGALSEAREIFEGITEGNPADDASWYYLGNCRLRTGDVARARECFSRAVAIDSSNYWYRAALASTFVPGDDDIDLVIAQYERLSRDFPKKKEHQYTLVSLYYSAGNYKAALAALDEIELRDGKSDATVMTRFRILGADEEKREEAYALLKEYVAEYSSPYILSILGDYEMGMYNDAAAHAYYDEALLLETDYFPARIGKAETFRLTRKYPEYYRMLMEIASDENVPANMKSEYLLGLLRGTDQRFATTFRPQLDSVMALSTAAAPSDTTMLQTAGAYYIYVGDTPKAVEAFGKVRELVPGDKTAHMRYIQVLAGGEDWKAVSEASTAASEVFPGEVYFLQADNLAKYNLKDYKGVLENAEKMLALPGRDTTVTLEALSTKGDMLVRLGDDKAAYKAYEKALKINPSYAPALNNYAWNLCLKGKQLGKAMKMSRKAVEVEPKNVSYLDTYGWILHLCGNDVDAKMYFKQAMIQGGKSSATVVAHYVVVLEALGEKDMAQVYREQLKKLPPADD